MIESFGDDLVFKLFAVNLWIFLLFFIHIVAKAIFVSIDEKIVDLVLFVFIHGNTVILIIYEVYSRKVRFDSTVVVYSQSSLSLFWTIENWRILGSVRGSTTTADSTSCVPTFSFINIDFVKLLLFLFLFLLFLFVLYRCSSVIGRNVAFSGYFYHFRRFFLLLCSFRLIFFGLTSLLLT